MNPESPSRSKYVLWAAVLGAIVVGLLSVFHPLIASRLDSIALPVLLVAGLGLLLWWRV